MENWKFFDITHRDHLLCNPTSEAKMDEMIALLQLPQGGRVLELACGKGEFLTRLVERYGVSAVGVDLSPYVIRDARQKLAERAPQADVLLLEMDGAHYQSQPGERFDLAACIGGSWIYDGHEGTLAALREMVKPGGLILVGEPYWLQEPAAEYLTFANMTRALYGSHYDNMLAGQSLGLSLLYAIVSSHDDWDRYEGLQWQASCRYALERPDDPDVPELLARIQRQQEEYLRWGRDTLGWALYLFHVGAVQTN